MAIEKPSANRFANPNIKTTEGESEAPTTPATIAKVVTAPSVAPYTKSSIDHFNNRNRSLYYIIHHGL
jgi:hypothetical protein